MKELSLAAPDLEEIEKDVRLGNLSRAQAVLRSLHKRRPPPRAQALPLARLARRAGLPAFSIRLLRPWVRPSGKKAGKAIPSEQTEYAAALIALGIVPEAMELLTGIPVALEPESLLFRAFGHFSGWEYEAAIPLLEAFVGHGALTDYRRSVGRVNLAAALVGASQHDRADGLLRKLREETRRSDSRLLHGNCLEIMAQNAIFCSDWDEAARCLAEAERSIRDSPTSDSLYVRKWQAILGLLRDGGGKPEKRRLDSVLREALRLGSWETVRDCEMFLAAGSGDAERLCRAYVGTPFPPYRRRMLDLCQRLGRPQPEPPRAWVYRGPGATPGTCFDPLEREAVARAGLKPGQALHRLLLALLQDQFKPFEVSRLHSLLYPRDHFHPESSVARVHQLLTRLRRWTLRQENAPVLLSEDRGRYRLKPRAGAAVSIQATLAAELQLTPAQRLRRAFPARHFTRREAQAELGLPGTNALRELSGLVDSGDLVRRRKGPATRYHWVKDADRAAGTG